eukprot:scaffold118613_cov69-Phaeocystis_antarctica.AAC.2
MMVAIGVNIYWNALKRTILTSIGPDSFAPIFRPLRRPLRRGKMPWSDRDGRRLSSAVKSDSARSQSLTPPPSLPSESARVVGLGLARCFRGIPVTVTREGSAAASRQCANTAPTTGQTRTLQRLPRRPIKQSPNNPGARPLGGHAEAL